MVNNKSFDERFLTNYTCKRQVFMSAFFKNLDLSTISKKRKASRPRKMANPFPMKLYSMLQEARQKQWEDVVSWAPDGLSFRVHDIDRFMTDVLPIYFNQSKFKSFQRQLNFYNFTRIMNNGGLEGAYTYRHRYLIRGNKEMCTKIIRIVGQDKPRKKSSSNISSSTQAVEDMQPIPTNLITINNDITPYCQQTSMLPDTEDLSTYLAPPPAAIDDDISFLLNFDDTPLDLEDPVFFDGKQFHLLSDEISTII
ncbi:unnamed protein product [Cylindrotheca closterium]|uniref:HSF-type DNA-binding domain-containing protein n=1 Tax=Cylindrotheca closterium TaxID=2856 RepID=A0AAD2FRK6_9STRA|nr:unnamed protein product [Cylindrotheca closterium]